MELAPALIPSSHRWHTEAVGSSTQICVSSGRCMYRMIAKSASRLARIIQILRRIRAFLCRVLELLYFEPGRHTRLGWRRLCVYGVWFGVGLTSSASL